MKVASAARVAKRARHVPGTSRHAARIWTIKKDIPLKNGDVITKGTDAELDFETPRDERMVAIHAYFTGVNGRSYSADPIGMRVTSLHKYVRGISKPPSVRQLERWSHDGIAMTPTGKRVEPDGQADDGSWSWMRVLGLI